MSSVLKYERMAHGDVPASPDTEASMKIAELSRADEDFLAAHPPAEFLRDLGAKRRRRAIARWAALGPALAACLALGVAGLYVLPGLDQERIKGSDLNMFVYHKVAEGNEILSPDSALSKGDEIQISFFARGKSFGAILSVDGRGQVTRHMPLHGAEALIVDSKEFSLLPYSYKLDDAPSFEDLYFVVSPKPFEVDELLPFLSAAFDNGTQAVSFPKPFRYVTIRVKKTEVPR
jgi:hypothetical protein